MKKKTVAVFFWFLFVCISSISVFSQDGDLWTPVDDTAMARTLAIRTRVPETYRTFRLDKGLLAVRLAAAPNEFARPAEDTAIIEIPLPDGTLARFRFEHSLVVEPGLLAKYPELGSTYRAYGIDDPTASARFDVLPNGFHAIILSSKGTVLVDPFAIGDTENYVTYRKNDLARIGDFKCEVGDGSYDELINADLLQRSEFVPDAPSVVSGTQLRTYRLALAATNEYAVAVGGNTIAGTLAAQVLVMNRVNGVYERDLAIHMNIVANNDLLIYAGNNMCAGVACTSENDPYTNSDGSAMLSQNTANLTSVIQTANYDIGHVFSTGGGGVATLNGPCGGSKARGVTGLSNPVGDPFSIDYVAHEMGHQWGANHTYNSGGGCAGQRSSQSAYEPGSGVTIMAYAGICGNQDLARNSIDSFHVKSLEVIVAYSQNGNGNTCAQITSSGNTPPTVGIVGGPSFNIPKRTPFVLTATASDADGDAVTYDWQEYDLGGSTTAVPNTDATGPRPIFRPYGPSRMPDRLFPSLEYILTNANVPPATSLCSGFNCLTGELLPQIGRTMTFQVIARDNHAGAGGISTATATVVVDGGSGPFAVTSPNTGLTYNGLSSPTVTWDAAGSSLAPVNAANVKISYSTDGGESFPTVLIASTPNDGSEIVTLPNTPTNNARIKIEAVGNIFFDISDVNFSVNAVSEIPATISGQVFTPAGLVLRNTVVSLIDSQNVRRTTTTSSSGTYSFAGVPTSANYTMTVKSKRYRFGAKAITLAGDVANVNFTGLE